MVCVQTNSELTASPYGNKTHRRRSQGGIVRKNAIALSFALMFLIAVPVFVHVLCKGAYKPNDQSTFWIGPVSTTVPYVFLAVLFLAHCAVLKSKSRRSAYCGAIMAWLSMMAFTVFLISQTPGPKISSTMVFAAAFTPLFYIPFLVLPYIVGVIASWLWQKQRCPETKVPVPFRSSW